VNSDDITVHQVQTVLRRQARLAAEHPDSAAQQVLGTLVEEELAAQAARAQGLDKDPDVLQALEAARREILARAYQDRIAATVPGRSSDDIDAFYNSHPALFLQRRIYTLEEIGVEANGDMLGKVRAIARGSHSPSDVEEQLAGAGLRSRSRVFAQAAEDVPLALLDPISSLAPGQWLVLEQPYGARLLTVLHAEPAPVSRRAAAEAIRGYLMTEQRRHEVQAQMRSLRETAKIAYLGNFASPGPAAAQPAASTAMR
jgi:EpsD family peptidyl-prolyl cis-trans isomerase